MVVKREGDRMTEERIANYNDHAKFLADTAKEILRGNKAVLDVKGVKEILALYLLIPYITPDTLMTPDEKCVIPKLNGDFSDDITLEDLRNTICHSFVTVEEDNGDGSIHGNTLILDDRVIYHNRKTHAGLGAHSSAYRIPIDYTHKRLTELFGEVLRR